jgi:hypothetical protein
VIDSQFKSLPDSYWLAESYNLICIWAPGLRFVYKQPLLHMACSLAKKLTKSTKWDIPQETEQIGTLSCIVIL